jgi:hypothetical protein
MQSLPLFWLHKTSKRLPDPYLVFPSCFFSIGFSPGFSPAFSGAAGSPAFCSPPAGAGSAGAAGAGAGGGGGGGGSSFLPHPAKDKVNAKRAIADTDTIFFPILIHLLSRHTSLISYFSSQFLCHIFPTVARGNLPSRFLVIAFQLSPKKLKCTVARDNSP